MDREFGRALEEALAALLYDEDARARLANGEAADPRFQTIDSSELDEAALAVRRMVRERVHRGTGGIEAWFPKTIAGQSIDSLLTRFCASSACREWREHEEGLSLEEAFYRFVVDQSIGDPEIAEEELASAIVRALAVAPRARFAWPAMVRRAPGGCFAITRAGILHAALNGNYLRGPVTPLIVAILDGGSLDAVARRCAVAPAEVDRVVAALRARGLLG
jgi:hypothetical protein